MRDSIEVIAKATMPNWNKFKEYYRGLPSGGDRLREMDYQRRLTDQYCTEFRTLLVGRCGELEAIHNEQKAKGK